MVIRSEEEWNRIRARGRTRFLVTRGVLGRGLPMAAAISAVIELYLGGTFPDALRSASFWERFALAFALFSLSGIFSAQLRWNLHERHRAGQ
jgi:hypothetical protein